MQRSDSERQHMDNKRDSWNFHYNEILHNAGQETTYNAIASRVVTSALNGVNGTVMAYGQTGAGKTFTMIGDTANFKQRGITARAIGQVFEEIADRPQHEFTVSISYMELYNEKIFDLLDADVGSAKDYAVVEDPTTKSMHVRGLTQLQVENEEEALGLLFRGETNRTTAEHQLNKNSNRSHAIFTIYLEQRSRVRTENVLRSKLHLVDLAGSERLKKTLEAPDSRGKVDSILKKESMYINKSLTYLEQVVIALTAKSKAQHIPYRQTKLTNILKDSLGGNCSTSFVACIWGESTHLEETVSTLKLAQRMMRVENEAVTNVQTNPEIMVKRYEREIFELKQELMMHDALANRSGISYDEFTPEESMQVMNMVRSYISASPEEENDVLKLDSMRQIRECFKQFKVLFQTMEASGGSIQNSRSQGVLSENNSNGELRAMASGNPDESSSTSNETGNLDFSSESKSGDNAVGVMDGSAGFGLGTAPANSKPPPISDGTLDRQVTGSTRKQSEEEADLTANTESDLPQDAASRDRAESAELAEQERNNAFNEFIQGAGETAHREYVRACRRAEQQAEELRETRAAIKDTQWRMEGVQKSLADKKMEQKYNDDPMDANEIVDEEEFVLIKELKSHKKAFRQYHNEYNTLKRDFNVSKEIKRKLESELLQTFEVWYSTVSMEAPKEVDEDVLDDGECFDKLEIERVMAEDPESIAFFKAQKAQRERARKQPHSSPKARVRRR